MKLKKKYSLQEISKAYKCVVIGDSSIEIDSVCSLTNSKNKSLSYISDVKLLSLIDYSNLDCLITSEEISRLIDKKKLSLIIHNNPLLVFSKLINDSLDLSKNSLFLAEPKVDLLGGEDGLKHIREIIQKAPLFLKEKGWLILENHFDQGEKVKQLLIENKFTSIEIVNDLSGIGRFTIGRYK